jgi:hypothetical protein
LAQLKEEFLLWVSFLVVRQVQKPPVEQASLPLKELGHLPTKRQMSCYSSQRGGDGDGVSWLSATQSIPVVAGPPARSLLPVALLVRASM